MTEPELLAHGVEESGMLFARFLPGFDDSNATMQTPHLPNHLAWILGHLALTMHRMAERVANTTIPLDYDPEPFAFGSTPLADPKLYPPLQTLIERFNASIQLIAKTYRGLSPAELDRQVPWGKATTTVRALAIRMVFHNGTHCGQLVDLRRALGMPQVLR